MYIPREHYYRLREMFACFSKAGFLQYCDTLTYLAKIIRDIEENEVN